MKQLTLAALLAVLASSGALVSWTHHGSTDEKKKDSESAQRDEVIAFLRKHVIGKTVVAKETIVKYAGNKVEGVASSKDTYTNLVETTDGFQFDMLALSFLLNYDLDKDNKRIHPGRDESATYLVRYDLSRRRSTGKLVGSLRVLSSTHKTYTAGFTQAVLMDYADGVLTSREHTIFYEDFFEVKGKWKPGASEMVIRFSLHKGKLQVEGESHQFDVDPKTMKRTRTSDPVTKWVSNEVAR